MPRLIDADEVIRGYKELLKSPYMQENPARRDGADCVIGLCVKSNSGKDNTIDPVKHGHWIEDEDEDGMHCSVCGTDYCYAAEVLELVPEKYNFCPFCGARMDEERTDENAE